MEERRREVDLRLDEMMKLLTEIITESREYRAADAVRQEFIKEQVKKTNGRVGELEVWQTEVKTIIEEKKNAKKSNQDLLMTIATVIMAVSAIVLYFKK